MAPIARRKFPMIITVAGATKRAEKLMRMCLKHNSTCAHDLSPLSSVIARCADLIKPTMGNRQGIRLWQRALSGCLSSSIHIDDHPLLAHPIE